MKKILTGVVVVLIFSLVLFVVSNKKKAEVVSAILQAKPQVATSSVVQKTILQVTTPEDLLKRVKVGTYDSYYYDPFYYYFRDKNFVYYSYEIENIGGSDLPFEPHILSNANPATFSLDFGYHTISGKQYGLNPYGDFSRDKNHIFFNGKSTSFTQNFSIIDPGSHKDCGFLPYVKDVIDGKEKIYTLQYDATNEYYFAEIIGADPATFEVLVAGLSKDKNYIYRYAEKSNFDVKTFGEKELEEYCGPG